MGTKVEGVRAGVTLIMGPSSMIAQRDLGVNPVNPKRLGFG